MKKIGILLSLVWSGLLLSAFTASGLHAQTTEKLDTLRLEFGKGSYSTTFYFAATPGTYDIYWNGAKETITITSATEYQYVHKNLSGDLNTIWICATEASGQITHFKPSYSYPYTSQLTAIDVSDCPHLVELNCRNTRLKTLDVSNLTKLKTLDVMSTSLTALDVSGLTNLTTLSVSYAYNLASIQLTGCTALTSLYCRGTTGTSSSSRIEMNLSQLDLSGCPNLKTLNCASSQLTDLELSHLTELTTLNCADTKLTTLDVSNLSHLTTLNCSGCSWGNKSYLRSLNVSGCTALQKLDCDYSNLTALDVSECPVLDSLWCDSSPLEVLYVSDCDHLRYLSCSYNNLPFLNLSGCSALTALYCYNSAQLTDLDLSHNTALTLVACAGSSKLTRLNITGCTALTTLYCYKTGLKSLDLSTNMALRRLDCYSAPSITALDLSQHTALSTLNCYENTRLTTLNLTGCTALPALECYKNAALATLNLTGCTALTSLSCYSNAALTDLNLTGCTALTTLNAYSNKTLPSLDLSPCTALVTLEAYSNTGLTELNLSGCKALTTIRCDDTRLQSIDLSGCESLVYLAVKNTRLSSLDLSPCPALRELYCHGSQFSLRSLSELAPQTKIAALSPQTIRLTVLAGEQLDLRDELGLSAQTTLRVLMQKSGENAKPEYYDLGAGDTYGLISFNKLDTFRFELRNETFANKDGRTLDPTVVNYVAKVIGVPDHLDAPVFSVKAGAVARGTKLSLSCPFVDAKIYYTLDGSEPTAKSRLYEGPLTIREDMFIRAIAILGSIKSPISEADYTIDFQIPDAPELIAMPKFSVAGGAVERGTEVEITCETPAVRIYYTLDGSNPTAGSREYTEPVVINTSCTLKALAVGSSMMSEIASVYYSVIGEDPDAPLVAAPVFSLEEGEVMKGATVSLTCATQGAKIYYRVDGSDPSDQSPEYTSPIVINGDMTIKAIAIIAHLSSDITTATYTIKAEEPDAPRAVETPVFSHPSGELPAGTEVSLSCATPDAQIYYTLDGSTPTRRSMKYNAPIVIQSLTTVKAMAFKGKENSFEAMAIYTVKAETPVMPADSSPVATPVFSHPTGEVEMGTQISLSCATNGAQIYYTLDGSAPTRRSTKYKNPIIIRGTTLIKAVAIKGNEVSLEATAVYTIGTPNETAAALANVCAYPNPNSGTFYVELPVAATVEILSANGMPMQRLEVGAGTHTLHITQSGLYFLRITAEGATSVQRVMVR